MKLTKATLKRLIKEELLKENKINVEDVMQEARSLGVRIESQLDDMDVNLNELVETVDGLYNGFRSYLVAYVQQETGQGISESRRRKRNIKKGKKV